MSLPLCVATDISLGFSGAGIPIFLLLWVLRGFRRHQREKGYEASVWLQGMIGDYPLFFREPQVIL